MSVAKNAKQLTAMKEHTDQRVVTVAEKVAAFFFLLAKPATFLAPPFLSDGQLQIH